MNEQMWLAGLVECQEAKAEEDAKLEEIFEQVKGKTDQLRVELEEKTQDRSWPRAPVGWRVRQASWPARFWPACSRR